MKGAISSFALFLAMTGAYGAAQEQASQPPAQAAATTPSTTAVRELTIEQAEAIGLREQSPDHRREVASVTSSRVCPGGAGRAAAANQRQPDGCRSRPG